MMDGEEQICDVSFKVPFSAVLAGPSKCGKSHFILNLLKNADVMYDKGRPAYTLFYYASWQPKYDEMKKLGLVDEWRNVTPTIEEINKIAVQYVTRGGMQVVIDDMMNHINRDMAELFTVNSHHLNITAIFLSQNLYHDNSHYRSMKTSMNYLVLFKNPASLSQAETFFRSFRPQDARELSRIYQKISEEKYAYLLIDLHQTTPYSLRIRTKIFPEDEVTVVYTPVLK